MSADTRLDVAVSSGAATYLSTKAAGVYGQANAYGATATGDYVQATTPGVAITAHSHTEAPNATVGDISSGVQASGNGQGFGLAYSSAGLRTSQSNAATATTDGGGVYGRVEGSASFAATTAGNDVTLSGEASSARMTIDQNNTAALTQGAQFTSFGMVQDATTSAVAAGNNVNAANEGALLDVSSRQANQAYVRAQSSSSAFQYGEAYVSANGVGNALVAGDLGEQLVLESVQLNDGGGIESLAQFDGAQGYDAQASANASGNSVLGYGCSDCQGSMQVSNDQTNLVDVGAQSVVNVSGGRSARAVANAVGNSATYYLSPSVGLSPSSGQ